MQEETKNLIQAILDSKFEDLKEYVLEYLKETKDVNILFLPFAGKTFIDYAIEEKQEDFLCELVKSYPFVINKKDAKGFIVIQKFIKNKLIAVLTEIFGNQDVIKNMAYKYINLFCNYGCFRKEYEPVLVAIINRADAKEVISRMDDDFLNLIVYGKLNEAMLAALDKVDDLFEMFKNIDFGNLMCVGNNEVVEKAATVLYPKLSINRKAQFIFYLSEYKFTEIIKSKLFDDDIVAVVSHSSGKYEYNMGFRNISLPLLHLLTWHKNNEDIILELLDKPGVFEIMTKQGSYEMFEGSVVKGWFWDRHETTALNVARRHALTNVTEKYNNLEHRRTIQKQQESRPKLMVIAQYYGDNTFEGYQNRAMLLDAIAETEDLDEIVDGKTAIQIAKENGNEKVVVEIVKEQARRKQASVGREVI